MSHKIRSLFIAFASVLLLGSCSPTSIILNTGYHAASALFGSGSSSSVSRRAPVIRRSHQACMNSLISQGVAFTVIPVDQKGQCTVQNQLVLDRSLFMYAGTGQVKGTCEMISALHKWEKEVVQPLAMRYFQQPVVKVREMGTYSCRNIAGTNNRSLHSVAGAIDIGGFTLQNGRYIDVERDWGKRTVESRFLADVNRQSCRIFNTVLGPNYNYDHRNHFHLDIGRYKTCK